MHGPAIRPDPSRLLSRGYPQCAHSPRLDRDQVLRRRLAIRCICNTPI